MTPAREALRLWLLTRAGTLAVVGSAAYLFAGDPVLPSYLDRWVHWDVVHYQTIAERGYEQSPTGTPLAAFFPGLPLLLGALAALGVGYTLGGLLVSFLAGAVAVVALAHLAEGEGPAGAGRRSVLLLLLAPPAVFLAAGYTESLFLAFALPAWLAARSGRWWSAGLLAAGASSVRVTGLFLAAGLVVEFLTGRRTAGARRAAQALPLLLPLGPPLAYAAYLQERTGNWLAWLDAQQQGWDRSFTAPAQALRTTWEAAFGAAQPIGFAWMFRVELLVVLAGLLLTAWLLWRRRWGEATYVGLQLAAFATSTWYFSVPRAALLWWPLWTALAAWSLRRPAVLTGYLVLVAPFSVVFACLFAIGRWAG